MTSLVLKILMFLYKWHLGLVIKNTVAAIVTLGVSQPSSEMMNDFAIVVMSPPNEAITAS
jgi:hypothetical protein